MAGTARVLVKIGDKIITAGKKLKDGTKVELIQSDSGVRTTMCSGTIKIDGTTPEPPAPPGPPVVDAGNDITVKEGTLVKIDGKASVAAGAKVTSCEWFQVRGPMVSVKQDENDETNMEFTCPPVEAGMLEYELEFMLQVKDDKGNMDEDHMKVIVVKDQIPVPPPQPSGNVLWDSDVDGKWGQARTIDDKDGNQAPNGKGIYMAASGNPQLIVLGKNADGVGEADLQVERSSHGRWYGKACNYNAALDDEFCYRDADAGSHTGKIRNRHQMGGACDNRQGLFGVSISLDGKGGFKTESCHNNHENSIPFSVGHALKVGTWYHERFVVKDSPANNDVLLEYWFAEAGKPLKLIKAAKHANAPAHYRAKDVFLTESEFWKRLNTGSKTSKIGLRKVQLIAV